VYSAPNYKTLLPNVQECCPIGSTSLKRGASNKECTMRHVISKKISSQGRIIVIDKKGSMPDKPELK
jgi:hypothetical protein